MRQLFRSLATLGALYAANVVLDVANRALAPRPYRGVPLLEHSFPVESHTTVAVMVSDDLGVPLTAADRCDRCGAQAYVRVELIAADLLFCVHHAGAHRDKLLEVALSVHDETSRLRAQAD